MEGRDYKIKRTRQFIVPLMDKKADLVPFRMFISTLGALWVSLSPFRVPTRKKSVSVNALFYIVLLVLRDEHFKPPHKTVSWTIVGVLFRISDEYPSFRYGSAPNLGSTNSRRVDQF